MGEPNIGLEPLWPQLLRYGIAIVGAVMAKNGYGSDEDWQTIGGAAVMLAPIAYRVVTWAQARRRARQA